MGHDDTGVGVGVRERLGDAAMLAPPDVGFGQSSPELARDFRFRLPAIVISSVALPPVPCCFVGAHLGSHGSVMSATGRAATPCSCQARLRACRGRDNACRVGLAPRQRATLESRDNVPPVRRDLPECGVVGDDASAPPQRVRDDLLRRAGLRRERRERSFTEIRRGGLCDHRNYRSIVRQSP